MPNLPYRHLARTVHRIEADTTAAPSKLRAATGRLPDSETLIRRSHDEHLTGAELARAYETNARTVYALLENAGRSREELWAPPRPQPKARRTPHRDDPQWEDLQRDYEAGDAPLVLTERYGVPQ